MKSNQPVWKFVANPGDANPIDHGGLFVLVDETGVYPPEMGVDDAGRSTGVMERVERDDVEEGSVADVPGSGAGDGGAMGMTLTPATWVRIAGLGGAD